MPTDEVTDAVKLGAQICGGITIDQYKANVAALKAFGAASEQRGYDRAIAEVVAWLREGAHYKPSHLGPSMLNVFGKMATAIEAGEHKP